jgi:hypothetical protein
MGTDRGQPPRLWQRLAAHRRTQVVRAELQHRGSANAAYAQATGCDPNSPEAARHVNEYLARAALEHTLAQLTTARLRWKMQRLKLPLPDDAECWTGDAERGVLSAQGITRVEARLRQVRLARIVWWCLLLLSIGAVATAAVIGLWPINP